MINNSNKDQNKNNSQDDTTTPKSQKIDRQGPEQVKKNQKIDDVRNQN